MNKTIDELNALTSADNGDELIIFDVSENTSKKITKSNLLQEVTPVDAVTSGNTHPATSNAVYNAVSAITPVDSITNGQTKPPTSNAVYNALPKSETGAMTIPPQTINNGESAEVTIQLIPNKFYCGRIDFANLPSVSMSISYNDFSGLFQDAKGTEGRTQAVLYLIGKASLATLHVNLANYTGSPVTIGNITVNYCLESQTMI